MTQWANPDVLDDPRAARPWPALWALVVGFFMILVDSTIVSVATPRIMEALHAGINEVVWVTSAYLLAYAVPLLVTGRLGDRIGPKNVYLIGLALFTLSSAWCGLSTSITMLIVARIAQGFGASLMTPQTMAVITRLFDPDKRGAALGLWGATAGVATLVGPILGGVLTDWVGWSWIFLVNVPVGIVAFAIAWRLVPRFPTHAHSFDWLGVALSASGLFLLVFGVQEGQSHAWGPLWGPVTVWEFIAVGVLLLGLFVSWQARNTREPLIPLLLFQDRNFVLANTAISAVGFSITAMAFPMLLYTQIVRGLAPTRAALLMIPTAVLSGALAPLAGKKLNDGMSARLLAVSGLTLLSASLVGYSWVIRQQVSVLWLLVPAAFVGVANAGIWGPLSVTATRNLPPQLAGAGAGVYNTTRQIGAVLGSAAIAAMMETRLASRLPQAGGRVAASQTAGTLPPFLHAGFSRAMADAVLLPAVVILLGALAAAFFRSSQPAPGAAVAPRRALTESRSGAVGASRSGDVASARRAVVEDAR